MSYTIFSNRIWRT